MSLEVSGRFFGVHQTTVMRWLSPLAQVNWQRAVQQSKRVFSGPVAIDAKWLKSAGVWWDKPRQNIVYISAELSRLYLIGLIADISTGWFLRIGGLILPLRGLVTHRAKVF